MEHWKTLDSSYLYQTPFDVHLIDLKTMNNMIMSGEINQLFTVSPYYLSKDLISTKELNLA